MGEGGGREEVWFVGEGGGMVCMVKHTRQDWIRNSVVTLCQGAK